MQKDFIYNDVEYPGVPKFKTSNFGLPWLMRFRLFSNICAKDSSGPYDFTVTNKLRDLAIKKKINFVTDIYPHYGSDGSAALTAGYDVRVGLIGPGVSASHGVERTHRKALEETYNLAKAHIENFGI